MTAKAALAHFEIFCIGIIGCLLIPSVASFALPKKYDVISPNQLHPTRHRRDLTTKTKTGHLANTRFSFTSNGRKFVLDLYLNSDLLHRNFIEAHQRPDGTFVENEGTEHCYYHGGISGIVDTSVVLSTCNGLRGSIRDANGKVYGVEPRENSSSEHIFYDIEDLPKRQAKCGVDHRQHNEINLHDVFHLHKNERFRRAATLLENEKRYITLVLVNDKRQYEKFKSNLTATVQRALEIANHVDELYKTINTRTAVVYVETWNVVDLIHVSPSASDSLTSMGTYNKNVLINKLWQRNRTRFDNVQLITGIDFTGSVVGMAGIGTICGLASTGVDQDFSSSAAVSAATVAHELGHNLGMAHDTGGCSCKVSHCVMSAVGGGAAQGFSSCSESALKQRVKDGLGSCMFDVPSKLFSPPICGNDFLEKGEQCDCGTVAECNATGAARCCNATTCTLQADAECAVGPCCNNCKFLPQGTICRTNQTECDLEEACTGKSQECPGNFYRSDGTPCRNNTAYCFEGGCRTHVEQCGLLWGQGAKMGHNICYRENMEGTEWSNCGQNDLKQQTKCAEQDILCGTVQCTDTPNKWPILGTGHRARTLTHYITINGVSKAINCRQGITDLGPDLANPTLTQQGTKCGDRKICIAHKCVNLTSLDFIKTCENETCYNGGLCNNRGHCHCAVGFACPDCKHPGQGGSVDSGHKCYVPPPTTVKPDVKDKGAGKAGMSTLSKSLLIIFLGVLPAVVIALILAYKFRSSLPCRSSSPSSNGFQSQKKQSIPKSEDQAFQKVPENAYNNPSAPPWHSNVQQPVHGIDNPQMQQPSRTQHATPGRAPPVPPTAGQPPGKPLTPVKPRGNAPLPPVRPVNSPPGPPKPAKLPPMVPKKPFSQ